MSAHHFCLACIIFRSAAAASSSTSTSSSLRQAPSATESLSSDDVGMIIISNQLVTSSLRNILYSVLTQPSNLHNTDSNRSISNTLPAFSLNGLQFPALSLSNVTGMYRGSWSEQGRPDTNSTR